MSTTTPTLDVLDRKILFLLDCNARQSASSIARSVKQGRDRVLYRMDRLKNEKVIRGFTCVVNPYQVGLTLYKTYLKIESGQKILANLWDYLKSDSRSYWVGETDGAFDFLFSFCAKDPKEYFEFHSALLSRFHKSILKAETFTIVNINIFKRTYFWKDSFPPLEVCAPLGAYKVDDTDKGILKALQRNAREEAVTIAQALKITPDTVRRRIEQLEESKVIAGYRLALNLDVLGLTLFKVLVHLRNYSRKELLAFRSFCEQHPAITFFIEQIGSCTLEIQLEVPSYWELNNVLHELRLKFAKTILHLEPLVIRKEEYVWGLGKN